VSQSAEIAESASNSQMCGKLVLALPSIAGCGKWV
jgi:hypothetical protein